MPNITNGEPGLTSLLEGASEQAEMMLAFDFLHRICLFYLIDY